MKKIMSTIIGLCLSVFMLQADAVVLSLKPAFQTATSGDSISLDLVIDGLGNFAPDSLGDFDIDIAYDQSVLIFDNYTLGSFLGDTLLGEALDLSLGDLGSSIVNISELSFLDADPFSGPSFFGPYLDEIQPDSFILAALDFTVNLLPESTSTIVVIDTVYALGDGFGNPLTLDGTTDAIISNPATSIPEPNTLVLISLGLVGWGFARKQKKFS